MKFTLCKDDACFRIEEDGRLIYTIQKDLSDKLVSVALKNSYGDDILHGYQIKKWYHFLMPNRHEFTLYEGDEKIGELHKNKDGFTLELYGVNYYVYGGKHTAKQTVIVFDRGVQVAEFCIDEEISVTFTNGAFGSMYAFMMYLFTEVIKADEFADEAFDDNYKGMYLRSLDDIVEE